MLQPHPAGPVELPQVPAPPCGCDQDPVAALKRLFVDYAQGRSLAAGRDPATRPVFLRLHGVAHGRFFIRPELDESLRVGLFGQQPEFPAWVRFSSDVQPGTADLKGTVGIGIKLFGVDGAKILPPEQNAVTHDFLLQNHDVFFVDTARDMCEFTCLALNNKLNDYLAAHPTTDQILKDMEKVVESALGTPYWSVLPYQFGAGRFAKYKLVPETTPPARGPGPDYADPFYLRADLHDRLRCGEARFRFLVQLRTDQAMPLDQATVRWSEEASPPVHVATLILPRQDLNTRGQSTYGENLAFNPWHALPEHAPVGSIAAARKVVYLASAETRRNFNAIPLAEPVQPRPAEWLPGTAYPPAKDTTIVRAAIHPAIGVARVGNSPAGWFIGPEVIEPAAQEVGFYRDEAGALKRQVARFRIYGYNAAGEVVRELTADWAAIRWTVHVANKKAAWYRWQMALDIPEAAGLSVPLRNATVVGAARRRLVIDGRARTIAGRNSQGAQYEFRGQFQDTEVYLGELRTDTEGRLLFFGGRGISASPTESPIYTPSDKNSFINADGWYDDTSDGPVRAEVAIEGRSIPVEPAWVIVAPPDYAPGLKGVRTLYDLLFDLSVQAGWLPLPTRISFRQHVYPILARLSHLQWTNRGFATQFGWGGPHNFEDPDYIAKLACKPGPGGFDTYGELRRQVYNSFRDPEGTETTLLSWPWLYGDALDSAVPSPRQNATVSPTQYRILGLWAAGQFTADWQTTPAVALTNLEAVPLQEQPALLDRAALEFCLADAFHPGCEVTWPVRHTTLFSAPFRIRQRPAGVPEPDYGTTLTPAAALSLTGPLHEQGPGDLTRWMGLPWQADTAECQSGYADQYDPFLPTFWPARVPNQVLTRKNYDVVRDTNQERGRRLAAFAQRFLWVEPLSSSHDPTEQMERMVHLFGAMGLLEVCAGIADDSTFPPLMLVASFGPGIQLPEPPEAGCSTSEPVVVAMAGATVAVNPRQLLRQRALHEAGWESEEQRGLAPRPVQHPEPE